MSSIRILRVAILVAGVAVVLLGFSGARGDFIILKDGFVIRGKVQEEVKGKVERTEDGPILEFIRTGFIYMDDGARRIIFSPLQLSHVEQRKLDQSHNVFWDAGIAWSTSAKPPPQIIHVDEITEWDEKWNRKVLFKGRNREGEVLPFNVPQHLHMLTPEHSVAFSSKISIRWQAHYLTKEFGPDAVRELLSHHKNFTDDKKLDEEKRINRRFQIYHFLTQAEWLPLAERELDEILKDFPAAKEKVDEARKNLKALKAVQLYDDIKRAHDAGQYEWVKKHFPELPGSGMPEKMHTEMRALQAEYETADANLKLARRYLGELPGRISIGDAVLKKTLTDAAKTINGELHLEQFLKNKSELRNGDKDSLRVGRLENFLAQAQQAERIRKNGGKEEASAEQLLSLAITGWLLGGRSAETKPEFAWQLWLARKLVFDYQKTVRRDAREKLISAYKDQQSQRNPSISVEEFAQMIPNLPPPEPPAMLPQGSAEYTAESNRGGRAVNKYHVQLPPEYHPSRPWPVLVVLHQTDETPKMALQRWSVEAARNGYIVAAPAWQTAPNAAYEYSADEHNTVLDTLVDLRRKFQVDSDRVFLAGSASGGSMAFDVGMSHPDQFAGVLPTCGLQGHWGDRYYRNAQYLPFYTVCGDMAGGLNGEMRRLYKDWIIKHFPMIYVEYKGRGIEQYPAEIPHSFDWMNRKTRYFPAGEVGSAGREFSTLRHEDNRFYWLSTDNLVRAMPAKWNPNFASALLSATVINPSKIDVKAVGVKQVTVWFSRGMKADITKPLTIDVNNRPRWAAKLVKPSLTTLLEDFLEHGDRQRLYVARVDIDGL
jgi:enterochelin esterase-like enzyme